MNDKNLIIQSNYEVLLETSHPLFAQTKKEINPFLELIKSPKLIHTYQMNQVSLWNAFAAGFKAQEMINILKKYAKFPIPKTILEFIEINYKNYGIVKLKKSSHSHHEVIATKDIFEKMLKNKYISKYLTYNKEAHQYLIPVSMRGVFKVDMVNISMPIKDLAGFSKGKFLNVIFNHKEYSYRNYQQEAIDTFFSSNEGSIGVIVLPCGSGKTIIGIGILCYLKMNTLIITPNTISLRQWKKEILNKTNLNKDQIGEYSGEEKNIKPVTISTYQILTYRKSKKDSFKHFDLFNRQNWGLIIYDEVHLLPAPVFRAISSIQSKRRLGLTATLVREDNREKDVFTLIGPKRFTIDWKDLEKKNVIANASCFEVKVPMNEKTSYEYYSNENKKFRIAAENSQKILVLKKLIDQFKNKKILIIGQYINQLNTLSEKLNIPLITGEMPNEKRQEYYKRFNQGDINILATSKIANFAVDLPNAEIAIQISGTYGSRQEEAQRLGRIIRPKETNNNKAYFFTLITLDSKEEYFAQNRKRFLTEQGYQYQEYQEKEINQNFFTHLLNKI